ncbi:MAG: bifunctional proline dehydrogenase/L-glutamate gamma-semialdehyde dehydrogenase PutA [Steroidobacteraceae bacterium]
MITEAEFVRVRAELGAIQRNPEGRLLADLAATAQVDGVTRARILQRARELVSATRQHSGTSWITQLLREYSIGSEQGLALMALAEAYLRVPDRITRELLVSDKLAGIDWSQGTTRNPSRLLRAFRAALVLAGNLIGSDADARTLRTGLGRRAVGFGTRFAMRWIAGEFVFAADIDGALRTARRGQLSCSFDMLGEAARTQAESERHFGAYCNAIEALGLHLARGNVGAGQHTISIKLSALHSRYEASQIRRVRTELGARLLTLCERAAAAQVGLTIDAEECERLELSLDVIADVARAPSLRGWDGLGMAVQAYQKRALPLIGWVETLAAQTRRHMLVRLVKGAYWDMEIKRCQERGLADFPVFTRKTATDVSYLACARALLCSTHIAPAFATHNAQTVATLLEWIGPRTDVEFQRLHGMGAELYAAVKQRSPLNCRIYAPVGAHRDLLPYLIRRMLENGANSSFVQQSGNPAVGDAQLLQDPVAALQHLSDASSAVQLPQDLYAPERRNSSGLDLHDRRTLDFLNTRLRSFTPVNTPALDSTPIRNPANNKEIIGRAREVRRNDVRRAIDAAQAAQPAWAACPVAERAACLDRMAGLLEAQTIPLMTLLAREAGKTRADALAEVREAVDFCRYYAAEGRRLLAQDRLLPGPVGERNVLALRPRGLFACISPWNFPLAIFLGQIAAALVTGNTVIAKCAPQTPLIAAATLELLRQAGVPADAVRLLGGGAEVGQWLIDDPRITAIAFTGSTATARRIAQTLLADEQRGLPTLIAETGGINAMIVDSTALIEQVVSDVIVSAFQSAGQRCSALRLLCVQEDIYDATLTMLKGAMAELRIGDPLDEETDVGPLIDHAARARIQRYLSANSARVAYSTPMDAELPGWFVAPTLIELAKPEDLREEVFGPVLHVTRWKAGQMRELIDSINATRYGLTLGLHSRLESAAELVRQHARVGNVYINRTMIGAVVGSQPFGGEGLSGTGPKAGGPHYLLRFCTERTCSTDTTSAGGNAALMGIAD